MRFWESPMRKLLVAAFTAGLLGLCIHLQAKPPEREQGAVKARVRLVDAETGNAIPGIVRVFGTGADKPLPLPGLYDRLRGLNATATLAGWSVVPATGCETALPRGKVRVEAVSGLEAALTVEELDQSKHPADGSAAARRQ
jgi:hypothetical protein